MQVTATALDLPSLRQQAETGSAAAQYELGVRTLRGSGVSRDPQLAMAWIEKAAAQNHGAALHVRAVCAAAGFHREIDWNEALQVTARAAAAGDALARGELELLGPPETFDFHAATSPTPSAHVRIRPRIETFKGFLPSTWCDWIIRRSRPDLQQTRIYGAGGFEPDPMRTNTGAGFSIAQSDLVLQLIDARIAKAIDIPAAHQEPTNVLHYDAGQQFMPHYDFLDPGVESAARDIRAHGQRIATFLIYLNDGYEGGETEFPALDWRFKGEIGDAIAFWNVTPDGVPDRFTVHAGRPLASGEKWLFSKWVRDRPFSLR